jgi:hypothetical protein
LLRPRLVKRALDQVGPCATDDLKGKDLNEVREILKAEYPAKKSGRPPGA